MSKDKKEKKFKIPKEVAEKVIFLDCRKEESIRSLKKALMKLPMVKSEEDLTTDSLEGFIRKIERKYMLHLSYVMRSFANEEETYSGMIKFEVSGRHVRTVYAINMWEIFAKTLFYMVYFIQNEKKKGT